MRLIWGTAPLPVRLHLGKHLAILEAIWCRTWEWLRVIGNWPPDIFSPRFRLPIIVVSPQNSPVIPKERNKNLWKTSVSDKLCKITNTHMVWECWTKPGIVLKHFVDVHQLEKYKRPLILNDGRLSEAPGFPSSYPCSQWSHLPQHIHTAVTFIPHPQQYTCEVWSKPTVNV